MKAKSSIDDFINKVEPKPVAAISSIPFQDHPQRIKREQKIFRLPIPMIERLRRFALKQSTVYDRRISETELVELAIQTFLDSYDR